MAHRNSRKAVHKSFLQLRHANPGPHGDIAGFA